MNGEGLRFLGTQVAYQLPTLLVLLVASVVSIVYFGRARLPSVLTLVAAIVWALSSIVAALVQAQLVSRANSGEMPHAELSTALQAFGFANSLVHAVCMAQFVTAIFVGRRPAKVAGAV